jgi:excisionase family DNA binding protein
MDMRSNNKRPENENAIRGGALMLPREVAEKLRVSVNTVYAMAANLEIPSHKIRCSLRFDPADIDDYLFFSKFSRNNFYILPKDIQEIKERVYDQVDHAISFVEKLAARKIKKTR